MIVTSISMKSHNKYDIVIFLLISSLAFGQVGGSLQVPRILAILFLPLMLNIRGNCAFYTRRLKSVIIAFILYAAISLIWSNDFNTGYKEVLYFIIHFLLFFEIIVFARFASNPLKAIVVGWMAFILCCSIISIWELLTDNHLVYSKIESGNSKNLGGGLIVQMRFTAATFFNYNAYCTMLCLSAPWVFWGLSKAQHLKQRIICVLCILLPFIFILYDASRGALLSFLIYFVIYIIFCPSRKVKIISIIVFSALLMYMMTKFSDMLVIIGSRVSFSFDGVEDESRFSIWMNSLRVFTDTFGMGTGAGGMFAAMDKYSHGGVNITHNLLLEVLVQYGFLFFCLFISFLWRLFRKSLRMQDKNSRMLLLMVFCAFPAYSIINSGYLTMPALYAFFASVYIFANLDIIKTCHNEQVGSSN